MAILINENTTVIVQGFTGQTSMFHSMEMIEYGTKIVGGVTPGKGGSKVLNRPVFDTVREAVKATGATASISFVPPPFAADGIMEAADAGIKFCVCITDGIPAHDMIRVKRYMRRYKAADKMVLAGPNCAGTISPGKSMMGIMPPHIYTKGEVGIIGRSGTLGYEAASQLKSMGIGVSTSVGIGGDPINGSSFTDHLARFEEDSKTKVVVMIGEIGGPQESNAAVFYRENMKTPVVGYIAGLTAPKGRRMGHAGAVISAFGESASEKVEVLQECGVKIVSSPAEIGQTVANVLASL
jgi:malate-CoA ligase subunit alpha